MTKNNSKRRNPFLVEREKKADLYLMRRNVVVTENLHSADSNDWNVKNWLNDLKIFSEKK